MKNFEIEKRGLFKILILIATFSTLFISCKKDTAEDKLPPVINAVTNLDNRVDPLASARYSQWVIIKGQHLATAFKVDFNGVLAADSLLWANDTSVTVKIPGPLPGAANNPVTVFTKYGQATYNFTILQPPPTITGFNPVSGSAGDVVTITGDWFTNITGVKFGTTAATIVSSTKTQVKVTVPPGISQAFIFVTTSGGTTQSAGAFGFKYVWFDDTFNAAWWIGGGWGGSADYNNTTIVKRGTKSIKVTYAGGWGSPLQTGIGSFSTAPYTAIKISIYGGPGTNNNKVKLILSQAGSSGVEIVLTEGVWTDYTIPLSALGNPTNIDQIWLQEFSGAGGVIYVDDFGLI